MWVWEHALFDYNPKRPDSTKKDKTVEVITKADHDAALRRAKAEVWREAAKTIRMFSSNVKVAAGQCEKHAEALDKGMKPPKFKFFDARAAQSEEGEDK